LSPWLSDVIALEKYAPDRVKPRAGGTAGASGHRVEKHEMTSSDDTPSKSGTPQAGLDPCWLPFTVTAQMIELGLGLDPKKAEQTLLQVRDKKIRFIRVRDYITELNNHNVAVFIPPPDPKMDFYHADDVYNFIQEYRAQLTRIPGQNEQAPAPKKPKRKRGPPFQYKWNELGAAFGTWLHEDASHQKLPFLSLWSVLCDLAAELGHEKTPEQESARPYIDAWLDGHQKALVFIEKMRSDLMA
jgi:hypothetical protein